MKLKVNKTVLEGAATDLARVIAQKNSMPILADILCEVHDGEMRMIANDTEIMLSTSVKLEECDAAGTFAVLAMRQIGRAHV